MGVSGHVRGGGQGRRKRQRHANQDGEDLVKDAKNLREDNGIAKEVIGVLREQVLILEKKTALRKI